MENNRLAYSKIILKNVSFDPALLNKEFQKCLSYLGEEDKQKLRLWLSMQDFSKKIDPGYGQGNTRPIWL